VINFIKAKHQETGRDFIAADVRVQEVLDPLDLLRGLKKQFPELWKQVNLELILPEAVQPVNRIAAQNGKRNGG
jgi:hypothetical protein